MAFKNFWVQCKIGKDVQQVNIEADSFVIGRAPECDLTINTDVVSRRHLKVYLENDKIFIKDLGSTNGTFHDDERLKPHEKYEYNTNDKLYIESAAECSLRITAVYEKNEIDAEIDANRAELEKRKQHLKQKNDKLKNDINKENYLNAATESVDSIFENLLFVTKNARFNKEKKIKEAQYQSQEMIDKANREIEEKREILENEIVALQQETKNEAKRLINSANAKAEKIVQEAQETARDLTRESEELMAKTKSETEELKELTIREVETLRLQVREEAEEIHRQAEEEAEKYKVKNKLEVDKNIQETLFKAQEKHSEIISEAYKLNTTYKEQNAKLGQEIAQFRLDGVHLKSEIERLAKEKRENEELTHKIKEKFDSEQSNYNNFKIQVINLENRNQEAKKVLESEIPTLESQLTELKEFIIRTEAAKKKEMDDLDRVKADLLLKQDLVTKTDEKHQKAEQRLDQLSNKINEAENNLFKLNAIKQSRNEELDKEIAERKLKQKLSEDETQKALEQLRSKTDKEIAVNLQSAKDQALKTIADSRSEAEHLRSEAVKYKKTLEKEANVLKKDAEKFAEELRAKTTAEQEKRQKSFAAEIEAEKDLLLVEANRQASVITDRSKQQADSLVEKAKAEAAKLKNSSELQSTNLMDSVRKQCANLLDAAKKEVETLLTTTKKESEIIRVDAEKYATNVINKADRDAAAKLNATEADAANIMSRTQSQADQQIQGLEKELEKRKKDSDEEIQMIRSNTVRQLDEQKKMFDIEEKQRNNLRVLRLKKDLNDVLRVRIKPFLKNDDQLEKVGAIIEKSVNVILLDEVDDQFIEKENYSNIDPSLQQSKVKKFWIISAVSVVAAVAFVVLLPTFKNAAMESGKELSSKMEKQQMQKLADKKRENDMSKIFNPDKTPEYQPSYTERVLYTESYVEVELAKKYREKWILELQDYFVHKLRLDENTLVPFIAAEANLIHDLQAEMRKINGNFVDLGVGRMREIENVFDKKIRKNITKESDYRKIMKFKEKFFLEHRDQFAPPPEKAPASIDSAAETQ